jgi:putative photosynthetic complex assembly protein
MTEIAESHAGALPRGILVGAAVLISFAIATTFVGRISDIGVSHMPDIRAYRVLELRFEDRADGGIDIHDAADGATISTVPPGIGGFVRATMRGLARERRREDIGEEPPFTLTRWNDGTVSLEDKTTGRRVNLDAFGPTNAEAFARLFNDRENVR